MAKSKQQPEGEVTPVKRKSKPTFHFCFVCRDWFYMTIEDFSSHGHYTQEAVVQMAAKSAEHRAVFLHDLKPPDKPKPARR